MDGKIEWLQVIIAFIAGVLLSATAKALVAQLRGTAAARWAEAAMHVNDFFDIIGAILVIALVATVLTKKNTSSDIAAAGSAFTGGLKQAEADMSFLSAVFGKPATADPDPHPGIGGYDTPRGPIGQTGLPGSTASTRQNPQAGEDRIHNAPLRPAPIGGRRFTSRATPTITAQQARGIPPPAENGSLPFHGPDSKTNPWFQDYPLNNVADTEVRPHIVISKGIPGGERQRNTVYYGGRQAIPGAEHSYKPASKIGKYTDFTPEEIPSRYVYGGINGGTDAMDDILTDRRMPYSGHGGYRGQLGHARGSLRGASLDGNRFYQAPDTELNQGGAYGQRIRGTQRHRPTIFNEPAPMNSQNYDTTTNAGGPDVPGTNTQVAQNVHVSPAATRRGWRRA